MNKEAQQELISIVANDVENDPDIPITGPSQASSQAPTTAQRIASGQLQCEMPLKVFLWLDAADFASALYPLQPLELKK